MVLGWTPPGGSRTGLGSLHLGYYDPQGGLHYAGGVGTGFSDDELARLSERLAELASDPPKALIIAGDPLPKTINWVRPELVAEMQFADLVRLGPGAPGGISRSARGQVGNGGGA